MAASTPWTRGYLRWIWATAQAANVTLLARLSQLNTEAVSSQSTGQTIAMTSGNGRSVQFAGGGTNTKFPAEGVTQAEIVDVLDRLLSLYDAAVAAGNTTDANRVTYMLGQLVAVRRAHHSFALEVSR